MLPNATDYVFTTVPSARLIHGAAAGGMAMTHEEWLWLNEIVRTLEFIGSYSFGKQGVIASGSTAKDAIDLMAASRTVIRDWFDRVDAVTSRQRADRGSTIPVGGATWGSSTATENSDSVVCPTVGNAAVAARIVLENGETFARPDGMAARRALLKTWAGANGVKRYVDSTRRLGFHGGFSLCPQETNMGSFNTFFISSDAGWYCNGDPSPSPEASGITSAEPFFYGAAAAHEFGAATTYFREKTDAHDYAFALEQSLGYSFPNIPWPSYATYKPAYVAAGKDETLANFRIAWAFLSAPIWKNDTTGGYRIDQKRSWRVYLHDFEMSGSGCNSTDSTLLHSMSVRQIVEGAITSSGHNAAAGATKPRGEASASGWHAVGYQLYAYPVGVIAFGDQPSRYIGDETA